LKKEPLTTNGHKCTQTYLCAFVFICGLVFLARADIIDRIAVSVGNRVITVSDIEREIRVTAFLEGKKPDLSPAGKRATADKMIEQRLIQMELDTSHYPIPDSSEIEPILADFKARQFKAIEDYHRTLSEDGITEQDVKDELLWARRLMRFIGIRFRPGVRVADTDIQKYFDQTVAPAARAAHPGEPVAMEDYREQIEEKLAGDLADQEMNVWLVEARRRNEIIVHNEVFQ
jgi:hypothetical protein